MDREGLLLLEKAAVDVLVRPANCAAWSVVGPGGSCSTIYFVPPVSSLFGVGRAEEES